MRLSSGVPGFDALVQGGIPIGAAVIVQGPAGGEKDSFLLQFVAEGLRGGGCALVVLSSVSPARYQQELREAGVDVDRVLAEGRLRFVDWFTYKENPVHDVEQDGAVFRASIDLANVGIAISRAVASLPREGERRAAMEVLSPALSAYDLSAVYGFAQSTKAKLERSGFTSLFVLEKEMHDERAASSIHQPFDGVVDIERTREGDQLVRKVAVLSLRGTAAKSQYVALEEGSDRVLRVSADPMRERTLLRQEELIKSHPKDPKLWLAAARNLRAMGESDRALKCVDAALNLDSKDLEAWRFKAEVLEALGRKAEAERARERATPPLAPEKKESVVPPAKKADASAPAKEKEAVGIGMKEDAATQILGLVDQRLRENPRDVDALFSLAAILAKANDLLGAVAVLEKLAQVDEEYPGLWLLKTQLHARRGELQKAEESRARRLEVEKQLERESEERQRRQTVEPPSVRAPPRPLGPPAFFCPTCGSAVREEDASCPSCGVLFVAPQAPPAVPSAPKPGTVPPPKAKKPEPEIPIIRPPAPRTRPEPQARLAPAPKVEPRAVSQREAAKRGRTNGLVKEPPRGTGRTNGLVNGLRGRTNGLVNGTRASRRGRTNGLVNGTRGRTNGLVNGLRGRTNGLVNGLRGRTNGLVNGTRGRTIGLVNGLRSLRSGMTNGLTNGSGFTNGLGSTRLAREAKAGKWKVFLILVVTIAMLLLPVLGPSVPSGPIGIVIDGYASDWDPVRLAPQSISPGANPNVDIIRVGTSADAYYLSFIVEVGGTALLGGGSPVTTDRFHVFLDTDGDPATGYVVDALGADHLLDLSGSAGAVSDAAFLAWDATFGSYDWRGWNRLGFASAVSRGSLLEFQVDRIAIDSESTSVVAAIHARAFDGTSDMSDGILFSHGGSVLVVQEPMVAELLTGPAAATLLQLDISALGGDATLSGLSVTFTGVANVTAVTSVRLADGGGNLLDERLPFGSRVTFQFPDRRLLPSSPQRLFVIADVLPSDGSTLGAIVAEPSDVLADRPVSVRQAPSPRDVGYLSVVPPLPRVDGGFAEWGASLTDPQGDAGRSDVDLTAFDARFSGSASHFYAAVDGRILSGTWVPEGNRVVSVPGTVSDSDRDTVPDAADPYPLDFNNDLVPDADSGGDVDGDGTLDHGQIGGTDWWLNTTIPASFPAPYADRTVSVFIGPWEPPFQTRDDVLRVFVDIDNATWSGYAIAGLGADRLVEVSGTEGEVRTADFFDFGGSYPGQWSWIPLSQAAVATAYDRMEFSVAENLSATGVRMFVEAQAPLGANDAMDGTRGTRGGLTSPDAFQTHDSSYDTARSPILETLRADAPPATRASTLVDANSQTITTQYNHQRKVVRAGDVPVDGACDATNSDGCWYTTYSDRVRSLESDFKDGASVAVPATIGLLDSLATTFPLRDNLIVAAIQFDNTNVAARTISAGNLEIRRGTGTGDPFVAENEYDIVIPPTATVADGMFAVLLGKDTSASAFPTYGVFGGATATGVNAEVKILVLNGLASSDSAFTDGGSVSFGSATSLASVSTSFPASSSSLPNIIVAAVQIDRGTQDMQVAADGLVLRRGTLSSSTAIASNQYTFGMDDPTTFNGISAVLVAEDEAGAANQAYSVWGTVSSGGPSNGEAKILAFRGLSANAVDSGSVSIGTTRTVIGTATTSFATGDDIVIGAIQLSALTSTRTIAASGDDIRRNGESSGSSNEFEHWVAIATPPGGNGQFQTFVRKVTTGSASPSYEGAATAPATSSLNAELKLVAIHVNAAPLSVATGSFSTGTTQGTTTTVTTGFQPKVYFLWTSGSEDTTDTPVNTNNRRGFGAAISTTDRRAVCSFSDHAETAAIEVSGHRADAVLCSGAAGGFDAWVDHDATLSDGFRVIIDTDGGDTSRNFRVHYLAIGGAGLTNVVSGMFTESGATGNQDVTSVGFQPDAVVLFSAMIGADPPGTQADSSMMMGFAAGAGNPNDVVWAGGSNDLANPAQTVAYGRAGESIALLNAATTATDGRAEVDAWLSNGFSLDWTQRTGSRRIHYVALKGGQHAVGDVLTGIDGTSFSETGLPFTPKAGLFLSHSHAQSTAGTVQDYDEWSLGSVTTATTRRAHCVNDKDGVSPTDVAYGVHHNALYCNLADAASFEGVMDVVSVNSDGWTLVMDDADPAASFVGYWAIAGGDGDDRIILKRSSDTSGSTWGSEVILASGNSADSPLLYSYDSAEPSIAIDSGGYLHLVWASASSTGDQSTLNRVRYTKTTVAYPTQSELAAAGNWEAVTTVDDASVGYMPTVSTDPGNYPHVAWSGSKTSGTVYYKNKAGGTWRSTVSWGTAYTGLSVDVSPVNYHVALARSYATPEEAAIEYRSATGSCATSLVNCPKTRSWDGSTWGSETEESTASSPVRHVRLAISPTSPDNRIFVTLSDDGWLDAYVCTPTCTATNNIGQVWSTAPTVDAKRFDVAYESQSGDAVLVYGVLSTDTTRDLAYKTYTGSWGTEQYIDDAGHGTDVQYGTVRLASGPGTDKIGLIARDNTNEDDNAWIWDGSAWGNFVEITASSASGDDYEPIAIAWESNSGHLIAATRDGTTNDFFSKEYTTSWSAVSSITCGPIGGYFTSLKANPVGDDMILVNVDPSLVDVGTCYWSGSAWANGMTHDTATDGGFNRNADFAWEDTGSKGLLVYGTTTGQITYRTFTAPNTWGTITDVAMGGANIHPWVQLRTNPDPRSGATKILGAVLEATANDLGAITWDGTTFTVVSASTFTADVGTSVYESFGLEYRARSDEVHHTVCKDLNSSNCDASGEFTKWDGNAGYDLVSTQDRGGYSSLATTYESNGDLWTAYAKDGAIYAKFLNHPSGGWATAETVEKMSGISFTRPSIGLDKNNVAHALYVRADGPQLYYKSREGGTWGADTPALTETLTVGSKVAGSFPTDISFADAIYIQYRESANPNEIGAVGYKSNTGSGVNFPKQLDWTGTAWGTPETELATAGAAVTSVRTVWDPATDSTVFYIAVAASTTLTVYRCTNVDTCSSDMTSTITVATAPERHFDIAIEQSSGDVLAVYDCSTGNANDFCYKIRTGGSWGSEQNFNHGSVSDAGQESMAWITLASNPGTNQIALGAADTTNDDFVMGEWDGSAWRTGAHQAACTTAYTPSAGLGGGVYPEDTADEFVAYCSAGLDTILECEWTAGSGWEATCASLDPDSTSGNYKAFSEGGFREGSNDVLVCYSDDDADPGCWEFNGLVGTGGARVGVQEMTATDNSGTSIWLPIDADYSPDQSGTEDALVVYYAASSGNLAYRTFDTELNSWTGESTFASAGTHRWVKVVGTERSANTVKAHVCASNNANDVLCYRWAGGGAPASEQSVTADTVDEAYPYWDLAFQESASYHLDIRHDWSGVPAGTTYTLKVKGYRVDENIDVKVLTPPSTWTTQITISATSNTLYTYTLTSSEYNSGAPSIRLVDPSDTDSVQSDLYADLSLVMTDHSSTLVADSADNPTIIVRAPNHATYGVEQGGLYWKPTTSETYFFYNYIPEFEAFAIPILGILLLVFWRRRRARRNRGDGGPSDGP